MSPLPNQTKAMFHYFFFFLVLNISPQRRSGIVCCKRPPPVQTSALDLFLPILHWKEAKLLFCRETWPDQQKTATQKKTKTITMTFREHLQRAIFETRDLFAIGRYLWHLWYSWHYCQLRTNETANPGVTHGAAAVVWQLLKLWSVFAKPVQSEWVWPNPNRSGLGLCVVIYNYMSTPQKFPKL